MYSKEDGEDYYQFLEIILIYLPLLPLEFLILTSGEKVAELVESPRPGSKPHAAMYVHPATLIFSIFN